LWPLPTWRSAAASSHSCRPSTSARPAESHVPLLRRLYAPSELRQIHRVEAEHWAVHELPTHPECGTKVPELLPTEQP